MNEKINKMQTQQIQLNADRIETQLAVMELVSLIHAYAKSKNDEMPTIIYARQSTPTSDYELRYTEHIDRALEKLDLRKSKKNNPEPEAKPPEKPESAMEQLKDAADQ